MEKSIMSARRVTFVNSMRTWGGAEIWMLDAALGLRDRGYTVDLIGQPESPLLTKSADAGLDTAAIAIRFDTAPWTGARLWHHFRRRGTEIILCNLTKDLKAAGVAARAAGVKAVLALRESDFPLKNKFYYRVYFNHVASALIANSHATRETVLGSAPWLDPARVHLLHKWVDTDRFRPASTPPPELRVAFLGQLIKRKGLPRLMEAWSYIDTGDYAPEARLHVAGEGPLQPTLKTWRLTLRRPERVHLEGFIENTPAFLQRMSLLVMPSLAEGFGLAAAEASACGLPVIASRCSSLPEIIRDGKTGVLIPPDDSPALTAALLDLLGNQTVRQKLGAAGRKFIECHFTRDRQLDNFEKLLASAGAGGDFP